MLVMDVSRTLRGLGIYGDDIPKASSRYTVQENTQKLTITDLSWHWWWYLRFKLGPKRRSVIPSHASPTIPHLYSTLRLLDGYSNKDH